MESLSSPGLFHLVLLTACLAPSSPSPTPPQDDLCTFDPGWQVLEEGIGRFGCRVDEEVRSLNCSDQGVPALPPSSDTAVPEDTEVFDFSNNNIRCLPQINNTNPSCAVSHCDIGGCTKKLLLANNEIDFIHRDAFFNLTCLESLDLSHNLITSQVLLQNHFMRLNHLKHLDLHGNPIGSLEDNVLVFTYMSHLRFLNLSSCQLREIGSLALDDFSELEVLDLSKNQLNHLSGTTFQGLKAVRVLDLRWNHLEVIDNDTFADMLELRELRLDHNLLRYLSEWAFYERTPLTYLGLFSNKFSDIPVAALSTLKFLQSLDMSHNPFISLKPLKKGQAITSVTNLTLNHLDSLTKVMDGAFSAFPQLSWLSLRFSKRLTTLSGKAFSNTSLLYEVLLDHNGLETLPEELLPWRQLSLLTLHGNPWHCDCRLAWAAGRPFGNTTISCDSPLKLQGQALRSLRRDELACPKDLIGVKAVIGLSLTAVNIAAVVLLVWPRRRSMPCSCIRGIKGRYITVFTKDQRSTNDDDDDDSGMCGEGEVDDLDLGVGDGPSSEGGRVMILLNSFRDGYRRLKTKGGESSQDLTLASEV